MEKEEKKEIKNQQLAGLKKFQARALELAGGDEDKVKIAEKMAELEIDFEFVKDLNTEIAKKYQELMDCFPTSRECLSLIGLLKNNLKNGECSDITDERILKLKKFRSALIALEKQDHTAKPMSYEDLTRREEKVKPE